MQSPTFSRLLAYITVLMLATSASAKPLPRDGVFNPQSKQLVTGREVQIKRHDQHSTSPVYRPKQSGLSKGCDNEELNEGDGYGDYHRADKYDKVEDDSEKDEPESTPYHAQYGSKTLGRGAPQIARQGGSDSTQSLRPETVPQISSPQVNRQQASGPSRLPAPFGNGSTSAEKSGDVKADLSNLTQNAPPGSQQRSSSFGGAGFLAAPSVAGKETQGFAQGRPAPPSGSVSEALRSDAVSADSNGPSQASDTFKSSASGVKGSNDIQIAGAPGVVTPQIVDDSRARQGSESLTGAVTGTAAGNRVAPQESGSLSAQGSPPVLVPAPSSGSLAGISTGSQPQGAARVLGTTSAPAGAPGSQAGSLTDGAKKNLSGLQPQGSTSISGTDKASVVNLPESATISEKGASSAQPVSVNGNSADAPTSPNAFSSPPNESVSLNDASTSPALDETSNLAAGIGSNAPGLVALTISGLGGLSSVGTAAGFIPNSGSTLRGTIGSGLGRNGQQGSIPTSLIDVGLGSGTLNVAPALGSAPGAITNAATSGSPLLQDSVSASTSQGGSGLNNLVPTLSPTPNSANSVLNSGVSAPGLTLSSIPNGQQDTVTISTAEDGLDLGNAAPLGSTLSSIPDGQQDSVSVLATEAGPNLGNGASALGSTLSSIPNGQQDSVSILTTEGSPSLGTVAPILGSPLSSIPNGQQDSVSASTNEGGANLGNVATTLDSTSSSIPNSQQDSVFASTTEGGLGFGNGASTLGSTLSSIPISQQDSVFASTTEGSPSFGNGAPTLGSALSPVANGQQQQDSIAASVSDSDTLSGLNNGGPALTSTFGSIGSGQQENEPSLGLSDGGSTISAIANGQEEQASVLTSVAGSGAGSAFNAGTPGPDSALGSITGGLQSGQERGSISAFDGLSPGNEEIGASAQEVGL